MFSRKKFLQTTALSTAGIGLGVSGMDKHMSNSAMPMPVYTKKNLDPVTDEEYWDMIRLFFPRGGNYINLENGYFSPQASTTLNFHQQRENHINSWSSFYMRREQNDAVETSRTALAQFLGVDAEELAITRNTTESLNNIICGYPWKPGDEVIISNQDYGSMTEAYHQMEKRHGIVVKIAQLPLIPKNDEEIIQAFFSLATPKTKLIHVTHLIHLSGQVLPVAAISDKAHGMGIEVVVDAAHSVAQLNFKIPDLKADYVAASLHKWLCCPLGVGMLWMKKNHIQKIWPLLAPEGQKDDNIRKFQQQGTRGVQAIESIVKAIEFHNSIGSEIKEKRLKYLMQYWVDKVSGLPKVKINTPWIESHRNSALINMSIEGYTPAQLSEKLFKDFNIFTVAIDHPAIKGVRVTPHLYTSIADLDAMIAAVKKIAG